MIKNIKIVLLAFTAMVLTNCTKVAGPLDDIRPDNSITVTNAVDYRPDPTVSVSKAGTGAIQIVLSLTSKTGRSIKEITKIVTSTSYTAIQSTSSVNYLSAPIAGNGASVTFNTSLTEYVSKGGKLPTATNTELATRFYFLITLDDGSIVYSTPVRVLYLD